jgi:hypothetical protein
MKPIYRGKKGRRGVQRATNVLNAVRCITHKGMDGLYLSKAEQRMMCY